MKTTTTITRDTINTIYATYEHDVSAVLAALNSTTPTAMLTDLQRAYGRDTAARANPATVEAEAEAAEAWRDYRAAFAEYSRIAHRIRTPEAERAEAAAAAEIARAEAADHRAHAADIAKRTARVMSDRADLVQVAALADMEEPTDTEREAAERTAERIAEERGEELTAEEVEALARTRHRRNAVKRAIYAARGVNALNGMHTDRRAATAAEVKAWRERYADSWSEPQAVKNGTLCLEWLEANKSRSAGWYFTLRRQTVSKYASIEEMNENGDISGYIRTANIYADTLAAVEALEDIAAALPPRDRLFIAAFCSRAAERAEAEAHAAYMADKTHTHAESRAAEAAYKARIAYAADRVGVGAKHRAEYVNRIRAHVAAAAKVEHTCTTPTEYAEHTARYWEHMQRDSRRGCHTDRAPRADLITWTERTDRAAVPAVVRWTESGHTPTASGIDYRAAELRAAAAAQEEAANRRRERAAAHHAAKVESRDRWRAAERACYADMASRPTHRMTAAEFNAVPPADRIALFDRIHADGKRLEII